MKIAIAGPTGAGKTSYLLALLREMSVGCCGYSVQVRDPKYYRELVGGMNRLGNSALSPEKRWPVLSSAVEEYSMELVDDVTEQETIQWVDIPAETLSFLPADSQVLRELDCLLLCIDGSDLQGNAEELEDVTENIYQRYGMNLCNLLLHMERNVEKLPPVCVLITKYDEVSPKLQKLEVIDRLIKQCLPVLLQSGGPMVTYCPVSIGAFEYKPRNVEKPLLAAMYFQRWERVRHLEAAALRADRGQRKTIEGILQRTRMEIEDLREEIRPLPLYVGGKGIIWE